MASDVTQVVVCGGFFQKQGGLGSPSSSSCWVRRGAQCPTMAAIATLWHLYRALDWARVILECHTWYPISRWTLPLAIQDFTRVLVSTPCGFICPKNSNGLGGFPLHVVYLGIPTKV